MGSVWAGRNYRCAYAGFIFRCYIYFGLIPPSEIIASESEQVNMLRGILESHFHISRTLKKEEGKGNGKVIKALTFCMRSLVCPVIIFGLIFPPDLVTINSPIQFKEGKYSRRPSQCGPSLWPFLSHYN